MEENNNKPKRRIWDKILMGAIIGGAIGSVIGISMGRKKAKEETEAEKTTVHKKLLFHRLRGLFKRKNSETIIGIREIPNELERK